MHKIAAKFLSVLSGATVFVAADVALARDQPWQCSPVVLSSRLTMGAQWLHDQCGGDATCARKFAPNVVAGLNLDLSACSELERAAITDDVRAAAISWNQ